MGAGDDRRTAELAASLEKIHGERGDQRGPPNVLRNCAAASSAPLACPTRFGAAAKPLAGTSPVAGAGEDVPEGEELAAFEVVPDALLLKPGHYREPGA